MGIVRDGDLESIRFPLGMDNTSAEQSVPRGAAREAVNVDIRNDGSFVSRGGATRRLALSLPHSLFGHAEWPYLMAREGGALLAIDPALEPEVVVTGLDDTEASYCVLNGELLWTVEGRATGRIDSMLNARALGLPTPPAPTLSAGLYGGLDEGTYLVALGYLDAEGVESGLGEPASIAITGGGIEVAIPAALAAGVATVRVYASDANGSALWHVLDLDAAAASATITAGDWGDEPETAGLAPFPPGHILRELNGVVWMAYDRWLLHSLPMRPYLTQPADAWLGLNARIDLLEPVGQGEEAGLFVAAGKRVYYFAGGVPGQQSQRMVRAHGAVPGSGCTLDGAAFGVAGEVAAWMGNDGVPCLGLPGGTVRPLGKRVAMHTGMSRAALLLRESAGIRQLLIAGAGGQVAKFAMTDSAEVYQYRDGKLLS